MIKSIINSIYDVPVDDMLHFLSRNGKYKARNINDYLLDTDEKLLQSIKGKFLNWFELDYSKIERYMVGKFKSVDGDVFNFIFKRYEYFLCSEDELKESSYLIKIKEFLDKNSIFGECILLKDKIPFTPRDKTVHPIKFLQEDKQLDIITEEKSNFYVFKTIFKITNQSTLSKYFQNYKNVRRFIDSNHINPSGSYEIDLSEMNIIRTNISSNTIGYFVPDNYIKTLFKKEIENVDVDISVLSFDIEVEHSGKMPTPMYNKISHIGIEWYSNSFKRSIILCNSDMLTFENTDICEHTKLYGDIEDFKNDFLSSYLIYMYMSEENILRCFKELLLLEPDIILSFNGHSFDFEYIRKRSDIILKENILFTFNILKKSYFISKRRTYKSSNEIRNVNRIDMFSNGNIMFIDIMDYCKTHILSCSSYSLDSISKRLFNINCKLEIRNDETIQIKPLLSMNSKIFTKVLRTSNFCFIDDIPFIITDKTNIIVDYTSLYDEECIEKAVTKPFIVKCFKKDVDVSDLFKGRELVNVCLSKDAVDIGNPESYSNYDYKKSQSFADYCRHDAILCRYIYEIELIFDKIANYSNSYLLPQEEALIYKASTNINGNLLKQAKLYNFVIYKSENIDLGIFEGGYVYEPEERYFKDPIVCMDFTSLYPTCILEGNISPDTLVCNVMTDDKIYHHLCLDHAKKIYKYPDYSVIDIIPTDNKKSDIYQVVIFDRRKQGIIPALLQDGLKRRKECKELLKKNKNDIIKYNFYNSGQYCHKIGINSIYGLTGLKQFPLGLKTCATACTASGRKITKYTINLVSGSYIVDNIYMLNTSIIDYNIFNDEKISNRYELQNFTTNKISLRVVYGDTDSIFVEIRGIETKNRKEKLNTARKIGNCVEKILNNYNIYTHNYNIEFEAVYFPFILCKKKRYLGEKYSPTIDDFSFEELKKGISLVRRDYSCFHKNAIRNIKNKLVDSLKIDTTRDPESVIKQLFKELLKDSMIDMINNKLFSTNFAVSCNYSGSYKDKDNKIDILVKTHNKKNKEIVEQGSRFYYVILVDKDYNPDGKTIFEQLNWNKAPISDVTSHKYILSINDNFAIPDNKRISIEYYLNKIYKDIIKSFVSSDALCSFKHLF